MAHKSLPLPSLRSLVLVSIPRCLGSAPGCPGRKHCLCCGAPWLPTALLLLLLDILWVQFHPQSAAGHGWYVGPGCCRLWGQGVWGCELCVGRCCGPKTVGPQELRCLKGIQGSSRNIAKQVCKRQKRNELKANFQLLLGYKQGNKTNHVTVQCAFVLNALYQCMRNVYCGVLEMDSLYYTLMNFSAGLVLEAA